MRTKTSDLNNVASNIYTVASLWRHSYHSYRQNTTRK